jgi:hypothetical protein
MPGVVVAVHVRDLQFRLEDSGLERHGLVSFVV